MGIMKRFLIFCMPATLVTALPFAVFNASPDEIGAGQVLAGLFVLSFLVLLVAIPAAIAWPFLLKLFTRISAPRPMLDVLVGMLTGDLATLVYGGDMSSGFWSRVYFMIGFGVAAWCYWWFIERSASRRDIPSEDDAHQVRRM